MPNDSIDVLTVNEYLVQAHERPTKVGMVEKPEVTIRRMPGFDEDKNTVIRWALKYNSSAYSKSHKLFIIEVISSERDEDYFNDMRFDTPDEALQSWEQYQGWEKTGVWGD